MAGIVVKPRARILHGHDWVFSSEVLKVFGDPADGDVFQRPSRFLQEIPNDLVEDWQVKRS